MTPGLDGAHGRQLMEAREWLATAEGKEFEKCGAPYYSWNEGACHVGYRVGNRNLEISVSEVGESILGRPENESSWFSDRDYIAADAFEWGVTGLEKAAWPTGRKRTSEVSEGGLPEDAWQASEPRASLRLDRNLYPSAEDSCLEKLTSSAEQQEVEEAIQSALADLPPTRSECLIERHFECLTLGEMAARRGVSYQSVQTSLEVAERDFRLRFEAGERLMTAKQVGAVLRKSDRWVRTLAKDGTLPPFTEVPRLLWKQSLVMRFANRRPQTTHHADLYETTTAS